MNAPMGWAKRAVGTMLAMRKPMDRMLSVEMRSASVKENRWTCAPGGKKRRPAIMVIPRVAVGGSSLMDDRAEENGLRPQRSGAEALENAALAVDGDDGDQ